MQSDRPTPAAVVLTVLALLGVLPLVSVWQHFRALPWCDGWGGAAIIAALFLVAVRFAVWCERQDREERVGWFRLPPPAHSYLLAAWVVLVLLGVVAVLMHFSYGLEVLGLYWPSGSRYVQPVRPGWMPALDGWVAWLIGLGFWPAVAGVYLWYQDRRGGPWAACGQRTPLRSLQLFGLVYLAVLGVAVAVVTLAGLGAQIGLIEPPPPWEEEARRWFYPWLDDGWSDD